MHWNAGLPQEIKEELLETKTFMEIRLCLTKRRMVISAVGREGGAPERPPPEIGKIVAEIWCYLPEVYNFRAESEIQEIFSKKLWKKSIFHRDFDQKISKLSWKFSKFSSILVQTRTVLQAGCLVLAAQSELFIKSWGYCIFL